MVFGHLAEPDEFFRNLWRQGARFSATLEKCKMKGQRLRAES
jgi:hypothetical protein